METVIRVGIIYVVLIVGLRLMGKREFSELSPMELVTLLLVPELVAQGVIGDDFSLTNALIAACTLLVLVFLNSLVTFRSRRFEDVMSGSPTVLVSNGEIVEVNMRRERMTPSELVSEMRHAGLEKLDQVRWAVLEGDGRISFIPKSQEG